MRSFWTFWKLGAVVCVLIGALLGCEDASEELPSDLVGVWRTSAPGYGDRYLEIKSSWVVFGAGSHGSKMHSIAHVVSEEAERGARLYRIRYEVDTDEYLELELVHSPGPKPLLRMKNRRETWTRGEKPSNAA